MCIWVTLGKLLDFVVSIKGIEIDLSKVKAIIQMPPPRNLRELGGLQGWLAYIRKFISNLSRMCQPFIRLLKRGTPFVRDQTCQNAFESIKRYLTKPPILIPAVQGRPLILYTVALELSLGGHVGPM